MWTTAEGVREKLALLGAELVDAWEEATCHVVDCFNEPGQRVTWASKLKWAFDHHKAFVQRALD